ncbi:MAG: mercuric ion transporter MerT [Rhodoferax sp.]|uniref:mercuric ion transporter MerT n=1 Tax=Rhodoferax sp. TaxID=50421 RepID=UPI00184A5189|nr:mercuric ion transporter MerT [Rhodoferax sp.]NMM19805.1 mercuric ion transporter MerT [Rhodoferax sp.]
MQTERISDQTGLRSLVAGGLATLLASTCCLGPLVLITLGFSGAWISKLTVLEPYQPIFIGAALVALFFAGKRIWRPVAQCTPGEFCARPRVRRGYQILFVGVCALLLMALVFPLIAPRFY